MIDNYSWITVLPEIVLLALACLIALVDLFVKGPNRSATYVLSLLTLALVVFMQAAYASGGLNLYGFGDLVVSDRMGNWLKCFAALSVLVALVYARPYAVPRDMMRGGELFTLSLFGLLGMFFMIGGNNFLVLYLGLELLTLSSYALVALRRDDTLATEAAMKYFVLGAMASGFLLYGMSMLYGATGSLDINRVAQAIATGQIRHQVLVFGLVFVVGGLAFKLGAVPFHMWIPDVYHGAPTAVTLLLGSAPKLAAFGLIMRLLVEGMLPLVLDWQQMLAVLAVASLAVGNIAAIAQTNIKRMLGYSTIAHMGFVLLGLMSGVINGNTISSADAYGSAMFYVITYVLTVLAAFGVVMLLSRRGFESEEIADFAGLNQRSPLYAAVMAICMFSLAGIPPMVGFHAKLAVLQALIASGQAVDIGLAVYAVVMSLIGAFYYLRVVKVMYFDAPVQTAAIEAPADMRIVLSVNGLLVLLLGIVPGGLMALCADALAVMMGG